MDLIPAPLRVQARTDAEGTLVADAWAIQHGTLAHYTYIYDHPPLGWIQMAAWTWPSSMAGVLRSMACSSCR